VTFGLAPALVPRVSGLLRNLLLLLQLLLEFGHNASECTLGCKVSRERTDLRLELRKTFGDLGIVICLGLCLGLVSGDVVPDLLHRA